MCEATCKTNGRRTPPVTILGPVTVNWGRTKIKYGEKNAPEGVDVENKARRRVSVSGQRGRREWGLQARALIKRGSSLTLLLSATTQQTRWKSLYGVARGPLTLHYSLSNETNQWTNTRGRHAVEKIHAFNVLLLTSWLKRALIWSIEWSGMDVFG